MKIKLTIVEDDTELREKLTAEFLKKNKIKRSVQPMTNIPEKFEGELESVTTYRNNKTYINFD